MDIAKIRKKLKEAETAGQQSGAKDQTAKIPEKNGIPAGEKTPEYISGPDPASNTEQKMYNAELIVPGADIRKEHQPAEDEKKIKEDHIKPHAVHEKIKPEQGEEIVEILTFNLLKEEFAFKVSQLAEILRFQWITLVPNVPPYILGITSLRGKIIPVIDLKHRLSLTPSPADDARKGKILIVKGPKGLIGVAADKVTGVVRVAKSEILPPPSHLSEAELKFISGIAVVDKRFVSIINMEEAVDLSLK
jgi:purine-binding chemotaxis protein CheW